MTVHCIFSDPGSNSRNRSALTHFEQEILGKIALFRPRFICGGSLSGSNYNKTQRSVITAINHHHES